MIGKEQPPQAAEPVDEAFGSRRTAPEQRDSGSLSATRQHTQVRKRASETTSSGVMSVNFNPLARAALKASTNLEAGEG